MTDDTDYSYSRLVDAAIEALPTTVVWADHPKPDARTVTTCPVLDDESALLIMAVLDQASTGIDAHGVLIPRYSPEVIAQIATLLGTETL